MYDNNFAVIQGIIHQDDANLVDVINYTIVVDFVTRCILYYDSEIALDS